VVKYICSVTISACAVATVASLMSIEPRAAMAQTSIDKKTPPIQETVIELSSSPLANTTWRLASWNGESVAADLPPITANFSADEIRGSAGCNTYFAGYEISGTGEMTVSPAGSTQMACEPGVMEAEFQYLTALSGTTGFEIDANGDLRLMFDGESDSGQMTFSAMR